MTASVLSTIAGLKTMPTADLQAMWTDLFDSAPPPYSRRILESRLAYRIQELTHGGLKPETVKRLDAMADEIEAGGKPRHRASHNQRPIGGTKLIREWRGVEHHVTVRDVDYEYEGRPFKSLSGIAREIAGSRWNGWTFFGLKNHRK